MNDDVLNIISKQAALAQEAISSILNTSAEMLAEMSGQAINELISSVQITLQRLISICYEQIKDELSKTQAVALQQLNEALAKAARVDGNKTYIEENDFDAIIQITDIPAQKRMLSESDDASKTDLYKLITLIIAVVTFIHSVLSSCDSSKSWSNLLQLEEKRLEVEEGRLEIEKAQNSKKEDIIRYLQSCLELLESHSESNQEIQGLHEETPEIQDPPKEIP